MADNSSMAFQIYKAIEEKQNELIKKKAIKPEEVVELTEESFIEELQTSVNFYTKNISNNFVVSEIYEEILKQVDRISDISQISTASGIKIPDEIIREGVKLATERTRFENTEYNDLENNNSSNKLISQFNDIESLEEKINFYESLSEDEKKEILKDVYSNLFGSDIAQTIIEQENLQPLEENDAFKGLSKEEQDEVKQIREANNPLKYICKSLGIEYSEKNIKFDKLGIIISRLQEMMENKNKIDENTFDTVSEILVKVLRFSKEDAEKFIKTFEEKYKKDPDFLKNNLEYKEYRKKIADQYEREKGPLKSFVKKNELGEYTEIEALIRDSFGVNGLNTNALRVNLIDYYSQKGIPVLDLVKDKDRFQDEYYRSKEEYEKSYKTEEFLENSRIIEKELLENFNMDEMANMMEDIYGSAFKNNVLLIKNDLNRASFDKSLDYLYDAKGESIFFKEPTKDELRNKKIHPEIEAEDFRVSEEPPFEDKPKELADIVAEVMDFSVGMRYFERDENKTTNSSTTVVDIRKLIEKQGHMEDIVATIGKISEIGKNGINSIEQEKNVDGVKKDDQKISAPSDEEKE